jgi:preprotein translocase subunit SecA
MSLLTKIFGDPNEKAIREMQPLVDDINNLEAKYAAMSVGQLKDASLALKDRVQNQGEAIDGVLADAFALVREAAKRTLGQRHFDVQLFGGIALHRGNIAEMRTGEGKTLTATTAVYLNALTGKGVHVVTVNDYLSRRDCVWMGQVYEMLGLTAACINHLTAFQYDAAWRAPAKEELTTADLAAASAKEEGGEADRRRDETGSFKVENEFLRPVTRREAYLADITYGTNNEFGFDYLRDNMAMRPEQRVQRPLHYAVIDEIDSILIDEARTPLIISAQAEEATETYYKFAELVERLTEEAGDYNKDEKMRTATLTDQGIDKLEHWLGVGNIYDAAGLKSVHHIEQALMAKVFYRRDKDYVVQGGEVVIVDEFTGRLMHGRRYSEGLHQAIEAREARIFKADVRIQRESQTLATVTFQNLFRMYEKLAGMTGTAATEAEEFSKIYGLEVTVMPTNRPVRRADLPDRIYKDEVAKFNAVVQEVKERQALGQPVLIGTISIEKNEIIGELLRREGIAHKLLNAKNHEGEAAVIAQAGKPGAVTVATNMAGRGVDIVLGGNPPVPEDAARVKGLGGLMVIGTERHESRRIDNQLRGRTGRQGDPGTTQFYVSLEDDLMRIFAGEDRLRLMRGLMDRMGIPDDMPIEHRMVSKSLETAQGKVEGHHFDIRKHLLEYDDVLNKHREAVYKRRDEILGLPLGDAAPLREKLLAMVESEVERVVRFHTAADDEGSWDMKEIYEVAAAIFPIGEGERTELKSIQKTAGSKREDAAARGRIIDHLMALAARRYDELVGQTVADMGGNASAYVGMMRSIMLRSFDTHWVEHLDDMESLRTGIGLQGYAQRDPLMQYKREAFRMFQELLQRIENQVVYALYKVRIVREVTESLMERQGVTLSGAAKGSGDSGQQAVGTVSAQDRQLAAARRAAAQVMTAASTASGVMPMMSGGSTAPASAPAPTAEASVGADGKVGRNDPCPCGTTKEDGTPVKFKNCHGK